MFFVLSCQDCIMLHAWFYGSSKETLQRFEPNRVHFSRSLTTCANCPSVSLPRIHVAKFGPLHGSKVSCQSESALWNLQRRAAQKVISAPAVPPQPPQQACPPQQARRPRPRRAQRRCIVDEIGASIRESTGNTEGTVDNIRSRNCGALRVSWREIGMGVWFRVKADMNKRWLAD